LYLRCHLNQLSAPIAQLNESTASVVLSKESKDLSREMYFPSSNSVFCPDTALVFADFCSCDWLTHCRCILYPICATAVNRERSWWDEYLRSCAWEGEATKGKSVTIIRCLWNYVITLAKRKSFILCSWGEIAAFFQYKCDIIWQTNDETPPFHRFAVARPWSIVASGSCLSNLPLTMLKPNSFCGKQCFDWANCTDWWSMPF
jgi:hypothetical protein